MEVSVPPPHEVSVSTSDTEQVSNREVSDDNTQKLQDLPVSTFYLYTYYYLLPYNSRRRRAFLLQMKQVCQSVILNKFLMITHMNSCRICL